MPALPESLLAQTDWLHRLAQQLVGDPHAADDLAQDTLFAALAQPGPSRAGIRSWLEGIARNLAAGAIRRRHRRRRRERRAARPAGAAQPATADTIARFEVHRAVVEAVTALDEPVRTTFLLRYWEDLPPRRIAERMRVPVETVRTRLKRGLQQLRGRLDAGFGDRSAWAFPLAAIPLRGAAVTSSALTLATLVTIMKTKSMAAGAAAVLGILGAYAFWPTTDRPSAASNATEPAQPRIAGNPAPRQTAPVGTATTRPEPAGSEARIAVADRDWFTGRVADEHSRPIPDVEVCLVAAASVDELREADAPEFSPADLRIVRTTTAIRSLARHHRLDQRAVFADELKTDRVTRSGADGGFRFPRDAVRAGDLVGVWSPAVGCRFHTVVDDGARMEFTCETWPRIRGRVTAGDVALQKAAEVVIGRLSPYFVQFELPTDPSGSFAIPALPPGSYYATFQLEGHQDGSERLELTEDRVLEVTLTPLPRLHTRLVDDRGRAWTGERIAGVGWAVAELEFLLVRRDFATRTELDSVPRVRAPLGFDGATGVLTGFVRDREARLLSIWCKNARVTAVTVPDFAAGELSLQFPQPPQGTTLALGLSFDGPAAGLPEVSVELGAMAGSGAWSFDPDVKVKGRKSAFDLPVPAHLRGRACRLVVSAPGHAESFVPVQIPAEGAPPPCQVQLRRGEHTLRGRVVDELNRPLRGARVTLATAEGGIFGTVKTCLRGTDADGGFAFEDLAAGTVRLFVTRRDHAGTAVTTSTGRSGPVTIRLETGVQREIMVGELGRNGLMVRLLDAQGDPLLDDRAYGSLRHGASIDLRFPGGVQKLELWRPGSASPVATTEVGEATTIDLRPGR